MAKIYTRSGDGGETSLWGGVRIRKNELRMETIGAVDEVNAALGVARVELTRSGPAPPGIDEVLAQAQHRLFDLGAGLAAPTASDERFCAIHDSHVAELESQIDRYDAELEPLRNFILPGGAAAAAQIHVARCACRRAERRLVELAAADGMRGELIRYINRLGDLLFVLARAVNKANQVDDVVWRPEGGQTGG
jgi:cob(I)alamin adenosyltransferase